MSGILFVASIAVLVLAWTTGLLVRSVRDTREIRRREEIANRERELVEYRYVVEQERNRIARDMHDVVAHSLAVVIAQADGARYAARTDPEAAIGGLGTIAGVARGALGDVRLLLAELRHAGSDVPQPVLDDLGELLEQVRAAGLDVRFTESGAPLQLGTGNQIAVYRIVQEGLTNALRHGDAAQPVELEFAWDETGVDVTLVQRDASGCPAARVARVPPRHPGHARARPARGRLAVRRGGRRRRVPWCVPASRPSRGVPRESDQGGARRRPGAVPRRGAHAGRVPARPRGRRRGGRRRRRRRAGRASRAPTSC